MKLFRHAKILLSSSDGEEQSFAFINIHKVNQRCYSKLFKPWIIYLEVLGLGYEAWNKREGTRLPMLIGDVMQLTKPFWPEQELKANKVSRSRAYLRTSS